MFSAFRMGPAASGLYDIDRAYSSVAQSRVKKLGSFSRVELDRLEVISVYFRLARTSHFFYL